MIDIRVTVGEEWEDEGYYCFIAVSSSIEISISKCTRSYHVLFSRRTDAVACLGGTCWYAFEASSTKEARDHPREMSYRTVTVLRATRTACGVNRRSGKTINIARPIVTQDAHRRVGGRRGHPTGPSQINHGRHLRQIL